MFRVLLSYLAWDGSHHAVLQNNHIQNDKRLKYILESKLSGGDSNQILAKKASEIWKSENVLLKESRACVRGYQTNTCMDMIDFEQKHKAFSRDLNYEMWQCCQGYFKKLNLYWCNWHNHNTTQCEHVLQRCFNQRNLNIYGLEGTFEDQNTCVDCVNDPHCKTIQGKVSLVVPAKLEVFADCNGNNYRDDDEPYYNAGLDGDFILEIKETCPNYSITAHYTSFDDAILLRPVGECEECTISLFSTLVDYLTDKHPDIEHELLKKMECDSIECVERLIYSTVILYDETISYLKEHHKRRLMHYEHTKKLVLDLFNQFANSLWEETNFLEKILQKIQIEICHDEQICLDKLDIARISVIRFWKEETSTEEVLKRLHNITNSIINHGGQCVNTHAYLYGYVTSVDCEGECTNFKEFTCSNKCVKWMGMMRDNFQDSLGYTDIRGGCLYELVKDEHLCARLLEDTSIISNICCQSQKRMSSGGRPCHPDYNLTV